MKAVKTLGIGHIVTVIVVLIVALIAGWLLLVWGVVKRPILAVPVAGFVGLTALVGMHDAQALAIYALVALVVWRLLHRPSFERLIGGRLRSGWVRWWVYERRWRDALVGSGLGKRKRYRWREAVPKIRTVISMPSSDLVLVQLLPGQCTEHFERAAPELAHSFGARGCRVREDRPGRLWLHLATRDPLTEALPALPVSETVDLESVPVGLQENGEPWRLRILGTHLLVAGATGAGKRSVLWSLLRGLAPEIRNGRVAVWAIDPTAGMQLGAGEALYARFAVETFEAMAGLLDDAVEVVRARARQLAGVTPQHKPTPEEPLILVVVDEVANLWTHVPDRELRERMVHALGLLLMQGRAVGVGVVAALQDPRKEVLAFRDLFPAKIALRLDEPVQVDMVLGDGAREQGARCDRIADTLQGVGYVRVDGVREPIRVRAAYVTDEDIATTATDYGGPRTLDGEALFQAAECDVPDEVVELDASHDHAADRGGDRNAS
jgi:S-DNA-T family DNA segregation ATPase FtsK/SpoIIIE